MSPKRTLVKQLIRIEYAHDTRLEYARNTRYKGARGRRECSPAHQVAHS